MLAPPSKRETPEEELVDPVALSLLRRLKSHATIHENVAQELDATDADGLQGGQKWDHPTRSPTLLPSQHPSAVPTGEPTGHPTLAGHEWTIRGTVWYDRNSNGVRDSNVKAGEMGTDVEFTHGVGGVRLHLVQCDPATGRDYVAKAGATLESFANTMTIGIDARGAALVVPTYDGNGRFEIHLAPGHGLERYYYVKLGDAPGRFRFTAGVCNDAEKGWECDYPDRHQPVDVSVENVTETAKGIRSGRSPGCVFVNKQGKVSSLVDFGVMREGDTLSLGTDIEFVMEFDDNMAATGTRRLADVVIDEEDDGLFVTTRYLLADQEKVAIGTVTAEVLAATLDARLAERGIKLESVSPKDVTFSKTSDKSSVYSGTSISQLAVNMEIKGHYSPPPYLDFDYMVQDSINRDTTVIRRGLQEYNKNCRDQTKKVGEGYKEEDFNAVVSMSGAERGPKKDTSMMDNVYSKACSTDLFVPQYFETSLKEVGARDTGGLVEQLENVVVYPPDYGILKSWAIGPVAFVAGLIVLLIGIFVFRRAVGPRRVDKFSTSNKTKVVASGEMRRFGEAGGIMDDGSVDSAFYTDSDSDLEETEKERRMRLKRKDKANEQRRFNSNNKALEKRASSRRLSTKKSRRNNNVREERKLLAVSQRSDDTRESIPLSSGDDEDAKMKQGYRGNDKKPSTKRLSSSIKNKHLTSDRNLKRGRSKRKGGDNAKTYEQSRIV